MSSFSEVVKGLKENKESQDAGFNRLAAALGDDSPKSILEEQQKKEESAQKKEQGNLIYIDATVSGEGVRYTYYN